MIFVIIFVIFILLHTFRAVGEKYIGARDVERTRYPWFVSIGSTEKKPFCGGCLIHPEIVLTAGHCISDNAKFAWLVDSKGNKQLRKIVKVIKAYKHIKKDLGIIMVDTPFDSTPISIGVNETLRHGQDIHGVGHGRSRTDKGVFRKTTMTYIRPESCYYGNPAETFFCTKSRRRGACFGDSGGPSFIRHSKTDHLVGITSHGPKKCAKRDGFLYTVYTDMTDEYTIQMFLRLMGNILLGT